MGLAGAFGTGEAPLPVRLAYWIVLMLIGTAVARAVFGGLDRVPAARDRPWVQLVAGTAPMSAIYTLVVWAVTRTVLGGGLQSPLDYLAPVSLVSVAMTTVNLLAARQPVETHAAAPGAAAPRFLDRMPAKLRGASLYAVEAEDHYLRLHTDRGSDLILMRLTDAVAELEGLEGAQTHRSWWVAKAAVDSVRREGGRALLRLKSGTEAPVSRSYLKALKDEGWF